MRFACLLALPFLWSPLSLAAMVETLAVLERNPAALEAIETGPNGTLYITNDVDGTILTTDRDGRNVKKIVLADNHPQVLLLTADGGMVVTAHAKAPDYSGLARGKFDLTNLETAVLVLDRTGKLKDVLRGRRIPFLTESPACVRVSISWRIRRAAPCGSST